MEAEMYGITPSAKIEAFPNAPPENMLSRPTRPLLALLWRFDTRKHNKASETINQEQEDCIDNPLAELLNPEDVFDCFYELLHQIILL